MVVLFSEFVARIVESLDMWRNRVVSWNLTASKDVCSKNMSEFLAEKIEISLMEIYIFMCLYTFCVAIPFKNKGLNKSLY